jgi:hypothetical protein
MRPRAYLEAVRREAKLKPANPYLEPPPGWHTIRDIQKALGIRWQANASTRAKSLYERGIVERRPWRTYPCFTRAFIYRLKPPCRTWLQAADLYAKIGEEKVPAGWIRPKDYAHQIGVTAEAVRNIIARHRIPTRNFRTNRGLSGLHVNLFAKLSDLRTVYRRIKKYRQA